MKHMDTNRIWNTFHRHVFCSAAEIIEKRILRRCSIFQCQKLSIYSTLNVYLSGNAFPHRLHFNGRSDVWSFWTWIRRSVLRPQVAGHNSHLKTGLFPIKYPQVQLVIHSCVNIISMWSNFLMWLPVWIRRWALRLFDCVKRAWQISHS